MNLGVDIRRALNYLKVQELQVLCKEQGLKHGGKKQELIERLAAKREANAATAAAAAAPGEAIASVQSVADASPPRAKAVTATSPQVTPSPKAKARAKEKAKAKGKAKASLTPSEKVVAPFAEVPGPKNPINCVRCKETFDLNRMRYSSSPTTFWCPMCRIKAMDPFNPVVEPDGVLHYSMLTSKSFDFTLDMPDLRQWRREGLQIEVRMVKLDSPKVCHVWPRALHFLANGVEVFAVPPPEEGHKRRDVPQAIAHGVKPALNQIAFRAVDDSITAYAMAMVRTVPKSNEDLRALVQSCGKQAAMARVRALLARRSGDRERGEDIVCLTSNTLRLQCPISMDRPKDPVRGLLCQHLQCFSLAAYLTSNRQMGAFNNRWVCPVCSLVIRPSECVADEYVAHILNSTSDDTDEVIVATDGTWKCPAPSKPARPGANASLSATEAAALEIDASPAPMALASQSSAVSCSRGHSTTGAPATAPLSRKRSPEAAQLPTPQKRARLRILGAGSVETPNVLPGDPAEVEQAKPPSVVQIELDLDD